MDSMRAVLMILGVVLHSLQVFNTERSWLIYSGLSFEFADELVMVIHTFRMPTFFIISGFFCVFTLRRYGVVKFARVRIKRIAIPLLTTLFTLNVAQYFLLRDTGWWSLGLLEYVRLGDWVSHLWFLINLLIYFMLAALFAGLFPGQLGEHRRKLDTLLLKLPFEVWLLAVAIYVVLVKAIGKLGVPIYASALGLIDVYSILFYFQFFVLGALLGQSAALLDRFIKINAGTAIAIIVLAVWCNTFMEDRSGFALTVLSPWLDTVVSLFAASLCFKFFVRFANVPSREFSWLSDASYTVYLFHHLLVIAFGLAFIRLGIGHWYGAFALMLVVFISTGFVHQFLVRRSRIMSVLFNGRVLPQATT